MRIVHRLSNGWTVLERDHPQGRKAFTAVATTGELARFEVAMFRVPALRQARLFHLHGAPRKQDWQDVMLTKVAVDDCNFVEPSWWSFSGTAWLQGHTGYRATFGIPVDEEAEFQKLTNELKTADAHMLKLTAIGANQ